MSCRAISTFDASPELALTGFGPQNIDKGLRRTTVEISSLIADTHHDPRFNTDNGTFEIVYGGATGAMRGFGNRLTQDQILHVMAYVRSLKK